MNITKYNEDSLTDYLIDRLNDFSQRERIVLNFPFNSKINRIEIYCSEALVNNNIMNESVFGEKFNGIVSIQVFNDYTNKAQNKSSYSYKKELLKYIPVLVQKIYNCIKQKA